MPDAKLISLDRMAYAVEKVHARLIRATRALERARIEYAVVGGNAVAAWVSTVDAAAVRNTRDVDVMIDRRDFGLVRDALETEGFVFRHVAGIDAFLEEAGGSVRDAVHVVFAGEQVRPTEPAPNPGLDEIMKTGQFSVIGLEALVQIKLTAYGDKDRTHLRDLIDVGLVDASWLGRLPTELASRLEKILNDPNG